MAQFVLSPGITPVIAEITVLGFLLSIGIAGILSSSFHRNYIFALVLAIDGILVSAFKVMTDYADYTDLVTSLSGIASAVLLIALTAHSARKKSALNIGVRILAIMLALITLVLGLRKLNADFYDPFDLTLSCALILVGLCLITKATFRSGMERNI
ncbi:MAG: hypothetical protein ACYC7D_12865 [Nitrososphaerales archaeon]